MQELSFLYEKAVKTKLPAREVWLACQAALEDTQDLAEELLYAEARMGEMLTKNSPGL